MVQVARDRPRPGIVAYCPSALVQLRASDPARSDSGYESGVRVPPEQPGTLKAVGWFRSPAGRDCPAPLRTQSDGQVLLKAVERTPPRHAITWVHGITLDDTCGPLGGGRVQLILLAG